MVLKKKTKESRGDGLKTDSKQESMQGFRGSSNVALPVLSRERPASAASNATNSDDDNQSAHSDFTDHTDVMEDDEGAHKHNVHEDSAEEFSRMLGKTSTSLPLLFFNFMW